MKRILIDSQNNHLFRGVALEQSYSFRGGLCQGGANDIAVFPGPLCSHYAAYWRDIVGLPLPEIMELAQNGSNLTVTELLLQDAAARGVLRSKVDGCEAQLEFFCIEDDEHALSKLLEIPAHADFAVAIPLARKSKFKAWWNAIGIPTPPWRSCADAQEAMSVARSMLANGPVFIKTDTGTGGTLCGGMALVVISKDMAHAEATFARDTRTSGSTFVIEAGVAKAAKTLSIHWEAKPDFDFRGIFLQIGDTAYGGVDYPVEIPLALRQALIEDAKRMHKELSRSRGYFCGDVVVDKSGNRFWVDFNPRKGAITYIFDAVRRIAEMQNWKSFAFMHRHLRASWMESGSFEKLSHRMGNDILRPCEEGFALLTNPGVFPFGYADVTGVAAKIESAERVLAKAVAQIR